MKETENKKSKPILNIVLNVLLALVATVVIYIALNVLS